MVSESIFIIDTSKKLWAAGQNAHGQLGFDTPTTVAKPKLTMSDPVVCVSSGIMHTLLVKQDNTLWACGYEGQAQTPYFSENYAGGSYRKTWVKIMDGVKYAAAGTSWSIAVKEDGTLWGIGANQYGYFGTGRDLLTHPTATDRDLNKWTYLGVNDVKMVFAGPNHVFIVKNNGALQSAGYRMYGLTGTGVNTTTSHQNTFQTISTDNGAQPMPTDIKMMDCSDQVAMLLTDSGKLYAWGRFSYTGVSGASADLLRPAVSKSADVKSAALGSQHIAHLDAASNLSYTTGLGTNGQLGRGPNNTNSYLIWQRIHESEDPILGITYYGPVYDVAATPQGTWLIKDTMEIFRTGRGYDVDGGSAVDVSYPKKVDNAGTPADFPQFFTSPVKQIYTINKPFKLIATCSVPTRLQQLFLYDTPGTGGNLRYFFSKDKTTWRKYDTGISGWVDATISDTDVADVETQGMTRAQVQALRQAELTEFDGAVFYVAVVMWTTDENRSPSFRGIDAMVDVSAQTPTIQSMAATKELLEDEGPKYYVSRDNGANWKEVTVDELTYLTDLPEGKDLKIKTVLSNGFEVYGLSYSWS
jgi:alpha-tubulin suppressor-like RCC1 family protein